MKIITNNLHFLLIIILFIFMFLFFNQCSKTLSLKKKIKTQEQINKQNILALTDSINVYKNNAGEISYEKPISMMSLDEIKKYFPELYKKIKDSKRDVQIIWKTKIEYKDTGYVQNHIVNIDKDIYGIEYVYFSNDSMVYIKSNNKVFINLINVSGDEYIIDVKSGETTIDYSFAMNLITGVLKENNIYKIFVTPDNDKIKITELEGADISELFLQQPSKQKRFSFGPYIGFGFTDTGNLGFSAGASIQYSLIKF